MADENVAPQTDVNSQGASAESSTVQAQDTVVSPPASETTGNEQGSEQRVPHSRFNEVIEQRNQERKMRELLEMRLRELEGRQPPAPKQDTVANVAKRLQEKLGLKEEAARELAEAQLEISRAEQGQVEARLRQYEIAEWTRDLREKNKDFKELEPLMEKMYSEMSPQEQQLVVASPRGLKSLYMQAKAEKADKVTAEAVAAAKDQAYQNKDLKKAISAQPGTGAKANNGLTVEAIRKMSNEEYMKRLPEINALIEKGELS